MSAQNLQIVRSLHDSFTRSDHEFVFAHYAEDIVWDVSDAGLIGGEGTYVGHDGVRRWWRHWLTAWKEVVGEDYRFYDRGDDIVVTWHQRMIGRHSDLSTEGEPGMIWTLRDGKVVRMRFFSKGADALAAAGVSG